MSNAICVAFVSWIRRTFSIEFRNDVNWCNRDLKFIFFFLRFTYYEIWSALKLINTFVSYLAFHRRLLRLSLCVKIELQISLVY